MATTASLFEAAKRHVEAQIKAQKDMRRRKLIARRLELVGQGSAAYQGRKLAEAALAYQAYVKMMEEHKGVPEGGLSPSLFSIQEELGDLLLLAGVYWDLVKLFDRTQSAEKQAIFHHYMEKYVLFSKGTPFQPMCAEGLRRYLSGEKPVHKAAFRNAYKLLGEGKCFVATSLLDVTEEETPVRLRRFRDERLLRARGGWMLVRAYYVVGPWLARGADRLPESARHRLGRWLDRLAAAL